MISSLILLVGLLACLGAVTLGRRGSDRPTAWFQLATYRDGKVTHLTPMRGGVHIEDELGQCTCNPRSGSYELDNGSAGTMYVHRVLADRAAP